MTLTFINITLILASILITLLIALTITNQNKKPKNPKKETKQIKQEKPTKQKKSKKQILYPLIITTLLALLLIFENNLSNFLTKYKIEILPLNYTLIFALISIIFIAIATLAQTKNKTFKTFSWTTNAIAITIPTLIYEILNFTHITLFNTKFSFLLTLLITSEIIFTIYIYKKFK